MSDPKQLVRVDARGPALHIRHPKNDASDLRMTRLSDPTGMERCGVSIARVPPGKESFVPHHHTQQEEWVYVLSGSGEALIGEDHFAVGPGDFLGFPCDGVVHHLRNVGDEDLVYLQGGERQGGDVGIFPTIGKIGVPFMKQGEMVFIDDSQVERLPFSAWMVDDESTAPEDG
jgi:uncharacterized cupin superfamily protein